MILSLPDSFFRDVTNPMWVFDDETLEVLDVNEAACRRYGYLREEFLAMTLLDLRSPKEQELFKNRSANKGRIWEHQSKSGEILYIEGYEFPFESQGRKVILAMIVDVTEKVKLEREKTELLDRYQILSEAANDLLWDWDLRTNQVTHSEALITQYGYDRSDIQQPITWWSDKIHPDDFNIASWSIQEAIRERKRYWTAEYRLKKADGTFVLVLDRGIIHSDANDQPVRMVGSIVDLTTRRAAEDERNQLFRLSIDSMLLLDTNGIVTQANPAFYSLSGLEPGSASNRNMRELLNPQDREVFDTAVAQALEEGVEGHFATSINTEAGQGKSIQWSLIVNEARNRVFLVGRNITESIEARNDLERALARSQELAIEAQAARKAQSEFLTNMSHELRTPLNGMLGTAQILSASTLDDRQQNLATMLVRSGELLLQIVNDILDFSKIESGKIRLMQAPFQLSEAVQLVFDLFARSARQRGLEFGFSVSPGSNVIVVGDPFRLRQVISNIVGNAIKFTDVGSINFFVDVCATEANQIEAIITIRDTGIGMPEEIQPNIFDRFFQGDSSETRRYGGTGLGLAISKTVAEAMGGRITFHSKVGEGSEFTIRIPLEVGVDAIQSSETDSSFIATAQAGTRVLIAEDVEVNAIILTSWLQDRGFECVIVPTGTEAIEALSTEQFDGAFVDLHMPGASGYDVVREMRMAEKGSEKRLPIIAVTASVSLEERLRCFSEGFDDYIPKPILVAELDRVVARLFHGSVSLR